MDEVLDTIAYIDRNAIVAGFGGLPQDYPWGSASLLFRYASDRLNHTQKLESMSSTYLREILKTRITLPGDWQIDDQGMLDPVCFVEWKKVEELYKTPLKYLYHLSKKLEGKINLDLSQGQKTFIPDKEMREITKRICSQSFGHCDVRMLDVKSRLSIARTLRREYASTPKQISRMLHLEAEVLKDFI